MFILYLFRPESRNPLANGFRSIFNLVICRKNRTRIGENSHCLLVLAPTNTGVLYVHLLVLVGGDGGEDRLREAEGLYPLPGGNRLVRRQFTAEVLSDDVNTRLILVHRM